MSNVQPVPASTQAGANSDLNLSFDIGGGSLKDLVIHLPPGLVGNPLATTTCTEEQLNADACPPASDVGDISNDVQIGMLAPQTATGQVFNVVPRAGEPARFGFVLNAPPANKIILQSPASLRPTDFGLDTTLNNLPQNATVLGLPVPITITGVDLALKGQVGNPPQGFLRNPTSCGTNTVSVDATAYAGPPGSSSGTFETVNCGALPFSPEFSANIVKGKPGQAIELSTTIAQTIDEAGLKRATVTLPPEISPNLNRFVNSCPAADFQAGTCPESTVVGRAVAASPLQSQALTGPVVVVAGPSLESLPTIGLDLRGALALKLTGEVGLVPGANGNRSTVTFDNLPDIPISDFTLTFTGGPDGLNGTVRDPCSKPPFSFGAAFLSHSGATFDTNVAPKVNCGKGKKPKAKLKLSTPKSGDPALKLKVKAGSERIRSAKLALPKPLSFASGRTLARGLSVSGKGVKAKAARRALSLKAKKGAKKLNARVSDGALILPGSGKVTKRFKLVVRDVTGTKTKLSVKAK